MLSFVSSVATLVTLLALFFAAPPLAACVLRFVFRVFGWWIERRSRARRELILNRVRAEEEQYRSGKSKSSSSDEEGWEKVEKNGNDGVSTGDDSEGDWQGVIGFFHPFCNAGGGGERVLWAAVRATQKRWPKAICAVYTGDHDVDKATMLENIENRFNIRLHPPTVVFLYLSKRNYVLSSMYPYFTLLGQSLGSLVLAYDAFCLLVPDVFIDTMGYAFALALSRYLFPHVPTGAYVHYPTISTDMLDSLDDTSGQKGLNSGAGTGLKGTVKRHYWHIFARLYGWVGGTIDVVMCNSSWTAAHITSLWLKSRKHKSKFQKPTVVFPPVAVSELETIPIDVPSERETREPSIIYIAQFRPEKNHALILRSFARFLKQYNSKKSASKSEPKLILIGTVRHNTPDETHIYNLRLLAHELRIRDQTLFLCDAPWPTVLSHLQRASIGVNGMWNEHFGIGVVEYQAAGLISVVHDSGGPKEDIVVDLGDGRTGFHATSEEEFAGAFEKVIEMGDEEKVEMRKRARKSSRRFSDEEFGKLWIVEMEKLVGLLKGA